jgi:hypothetical protein
MAVKRFDESRRAVLAAASGVGLGLVACSDSTADGTGGAGGGGSDDLADVIYEGGASDEALEALLAQTDGGRRGRRHALPRSGRRRGARRDHAGELRMGRGDDRAERALPNAPAGVALLARRACWSARSACCSASRRRTRTARR